jgi:hypothetical protein
MLKRYPRERLYLMGLSYGLALGFASAVLMDRQGSFRRRIAAVVLGLGLVGCLAIAARFLLGSCTSAMHVAYTALFGARMAGFKDVVVFALTAAFVLAGALWLRRSRTRGATVGAAEGV